jgi:hypothetical protein
LVVRRFMKSTLTSTLTINRGSIDDEYLATGGAEVRRRHAQRRCRVAQRQPRLQLVELRQRHAPRRRAAADGDGGGVEAGVTRCSS